jgi:hypothetical protein
MCFNNNIFNNLDDLTKNCDIFAKDTLVQKHAKNEGLDKIKGKKVLFS